MMSKLFAARLAPLGVLVLEIRPGIINTDMLQICFGSQASSHPDAGAWARRAVPFLLGLDARHNGKSLNVPQS